jgi:hypothetical protein
MARVHFSRKYYNSPMPHSIFFYYGFAIHGTNDIGQPAHRDQLERFRAKDALGLDRGWTPVRVKKTRQTKE